jgi:hypothetical protein
MGSSRRTAEGKRAAVVQREASAGLEPGQRARGRGGGRWPVREDEFSEEEGDEVERVLEEGRRMQELLAQAQAQVCQGYQALPAGTTS